MPEMEPLAMLYSGHQFGGLMRHQLGDGRAILSGEVRNEGRESGISASEEGGADAVLARVRWPCGSRVRPSGSISAASDAWAGDSATTGRFVVVGERPPGLPRAGRNRRDARADGAIPCALRHAEIFYYRKQHEQLKILADYVIANHFPHMADGRTSTRDSSPRSSSARRG